MKNAPVGLAEAKNKLSELLDRVEQGEEIVITRHGHAVARLVPAARRSNEEAGLAVKAMRALRARNPVKVTTQEILQMKNVGRR